MASITRLPTIGDSVTNPITAEPPIAWLGPMTVIVKNDSASALTTVAFDASDYLVCRAFDFSAIPDNATINGISIQYLVQTTDVSASPTPSLWQNNAIWGTSPTNPTVSDPAPAWNSMVIGSSTSKWVTSGGLTVNDIKDSGFGVALYVPACPPSNTVSVDWVEMTIYYDVPASPAASATPEIPAVVPAVTPAIIPSIV